MFLDDSFMELPLVLPLVMLKGALVVYYCRTQLPTDDAVHGGKGADGGGGGGGGVDGTDPTTPTRAGGGGGTGNSIMRANK